MCTVSPDDGRQAVGIHKEEAAVSELLRTRASAAVIVKALIVALRAAAAITPYYTEATPPHRLRIPPRDPGQDQIRQLPLSGCSN